MVVRFENTIEKKILNFIATLTTEEERSGLFNLAMKGLRRLLEQKGFTYTKNASATKTEMMRSGSSIAMFASEMLEKQDGNILTKDEMYSHYTKFCRDNGLSTQSIRTLGLKLHGYTEYVEDTSHSITVNGRHTSERVWKNAKVKGAEQQQATKVEVVATFGDFDNIQPDNIDL
jgi:phage/plasmid-associated DNA primase